MTLPSGGFEQVVVMGVEPNTLLGNVWNLVEGRPDSILQADGVIVDRWDQKKLEFPKLGETRELGGKRARIVGISRGVLGFLVTPYIFTTYERAAAYLGKSPELCSYYLVEVRPGADIEAVCRQIRQRVPELEACPKRVYSRISANYWMTRTGLGISFGAATLLGLTVGMVIVAQTLYALVLDRLAEFGTLKAIGATERQVYSILLAQAAVMAVVGSVLGLILVFGIQGFFSTPIAPIVVPWWLSLGGALMVLGICLVSSLLPYYRIRKLDPLIVLQS
jgi:putative ABC transport system permease protein